MLEFLMKYGKSWPKQTLFLFLPPQEQEQISCSFGVYIGLCGEVSSMMPREYSSTQNIMNSSVCIFAIFFSGLINFLKHSFLKVQMARFQKPCGQLNMPVNCHVILAYQGLFANEANSQKLSICTCQTLTLAQML